ncbi:MoaD/ThiS family protein [Helicobacter ailurogastricus]|uniref:Molybdenum cofactor biosynthesis protein MoaD n=1 Tax=Helicobacter ailurogastricus TaxID=1578720 RepID=A0A0K2Y213_9HELI|nr:MoaD/ThiS family protein [Helicobacter ailurogastricus]CRF52362.1 Molybdenum cofactor biosynthesis protein MoaD [Helicobacter ailurogastricus]BDQ29486.1 molybdopterin synthase sulfur carrier subunit [Helicobacter ailurogastricus]GLH58205.1 Molybdopterin converting factor, subunit 1 MoaD [Helicobacter ailurogastricus]GLH59820.1 Molybdopterin converting factor, subunit 1 MoaD [Helicobacter ailurogastricus]GMB90174.1 Molybdopterin converting factor, subunit 1 MoaD [Helicobacter ailurogastricus
MVSVRFLGPIKEESLELDITNLEGLRQILHAKAQVKPWLAMSAIALNGVLIEDINTPLKAGDEVVVLPPVCGG